MQNATEPERYTGSSVKNIAQDFELLRFGADRRICPAIQLGAFVVEIALANFLYKFDWELIPDMKSEDIDVRAVAGMGIHKKVYLRLIAMTGAEHSTGQLGQCPR